MERNVFVVNATQIVTSEQNPQGLLSTVNGYPKVFDSTSYDGNVEQTMKAAKADYYNRLGINYADTNPNRVMTTVMLYNAKGEMLLHESIGDFPEIVPPVNEEEPQEPEEEPQEEPQEPGEGE